MLIKYNKLLIICQVFFKKFLFFHKNIVISNILQDFANFAFFLVCTIPVQAEFS